MHCHALRPAPTGQQLTFCSLLRMASWLLMGDMHTRSHASQAFPTARFMSAADPLLQYINSRAFPDNKHAFCTGSIICFFNVGPA